MPSVNAGGILFFSASDFRDVSLSDHIHFLVGTYTDGASQGIERIALDVSTGELAHIRTQLRATNPSFLCKHPCSEEQTLYTASELSQQEGAQLYSVNSKGEHRIAVQGDYPCHLSCDPQGQYLALANYGSGNANVYLLNNEGIAQQCVAGLFVAGCGANAERQERPHAHQVTFLTQSDHLAVVDLGSDRIYFYQFDRESHSFTLLQSIVMPAGSGPRHLVFNSTETHAYVVCELSETLVTLQRQEQKWVSAHEMPLLPNTESGEAASAIKMSRDERFLYVSCRAQNKVVCFELQQHLPVLVDDVDCGGQFPRDFALSHDEQWLVVANQRSNNLTSYHRNSNTGQLEATGYHCEVGSPVCVMPI